ncbi:Signal-transduction histidine kinase senX3 [Agrobacterium sp. DSM 25558]|uniref:sensor histidine kinase n=1 Tax=Agrobacterium sp. DSM 25558 TaxID=1907665 RepID=UPI00097243ED|nr:ATP-binding protein [Agrobacterium sp. DSM 25558]SCX28048.1 Signal-transduction histidine kinase senX3 [Agrobacterium sp. DSM 25558]
MTTSSIEVALDQILSLSYSERLTAARFLALHARPKDIDVIRQARARENIGWIRKALDDAIVRLKPDIPISDPDAEAQPIPNEILDGLNAKALETSTALLIHELEPLIGRLKLVASDELANFDDSQTAKAIVRIDNFLAALTRLRKAASAPKLDEFALDTLIQEVVAENDHRPDIAFQLSGPAHCIVVGDRSLIEMCVSNGVRNAVEATEALVNGKVNPVLLSWSSTDTYNWVSIVDVGIGFTGNPVHAMEIGKTTKAGHFGMGLAIAQKSIASMSGALHLISNTRGVRFEIQWPKEMGGI